MENFILAAWLYVLEGQDALDKWEPEWHLAIDAGRLNQRNVYDCVLGQLFGSYDAGLEALGIHADDAWQYGFDRRSDSDITYDLLTDKWQQLLTDRV